MGVATIINADVNQWIQNTEIEHGLRIEKVVTPSFVPYVSNGDRVTIQANVDEKGRVTQTQSLEYTNENLADAYEYAVRKWKFEQKGNDYVVIIPIVASNIN